MSSKDCTPEAFATPQIATLDSMLPIQMKREAS